MVVHIVRLDRDEPDRNHPERAGQKREADNTELFVVCLHKRVDVFHTSIIRYTKKHMIAFLFAHAGEVHDSALETTAHSLAWYIQLPIFLLALFGVFSILRMVLKDAQKASLITATLLLILGFGLFKIAPVVSATAITLGLITTLLTTLIDLGTDKKE